jgi:long-chain acyl-CoA synthetase
LFVDESFVDQARELERQLPWVKTLVYMGEGEAPEGMLGYEDLIERHDAIANANRQGEDLWVIFYTGGTTAHPKGVMMSHRALFIATITYLAMLPDIEDLSFVYVAGFFHFAGAKRCLGSKGWRPACMGCNRGFDFADQSQPTCGDGAQPETGILSAA